MQNSAPMNRTHSETGHNSGPALTTSRTTIRRIGNSKGIILSNSILSSMNLEEGSEVEIRLDGLQMQMVPVAKKRDVNTDLSTWGSQFKSAIRKGQMPEKDLFESMVNEFDAEDWK